MNIEKKKEEIGEKKSIILFDYSSSMKEIEIRGINRWNSNNKVVWIEIN